MLKALGRLARQAVRVVCNAVAPYRVEVYDFNGYLPWGTHYAHTAAGALAWVAQYPAGSQAVVFGRRWQVLALRTT
jgi:hypothetical protein